MKIGDAFSNEFKSEHANNIISQPGNVFIAFVKDTKPPKTKMFVVVGHDENKTNIACVYINSEINQFSIKNKLVHLHHCIYAAHFDFLDHNSYIDCCNLIIKPYSEIYDIAFYNDKSFLGSISFEDMFIVFENLKNTNTIAPKLKKMFKLV